MTEKIEALRTMRTGAEALRKVAAAETDPNLIAKLIRVAAEMDEHAAELEHSLVKQQPSPTGAVA